MDLPSVVLYFSPQCMNALISAYGYNSTHGADMLCALRITFDRYKIGHAAVGDSHSQYFD